MGHQNDEKRKKNKNNKILALASVGRTTKHPGNIEKLISPLSDSVYLFMVMRSQNEWENFRAQRREPKQI